MSETEKRKYARKIKVFVVTDKYGNDRLIRAYKVADVLSHVTPSFAVALASQDDIISLMAAGVEVETAGIHEQELPAGEAAGLSD